MGKWEEEQKRPLSSISLSFLPFLLFSLCNGRLALITDSTHTRTPNTEEEEEENEGGKTTSLFM